MSKVKTNIYRFLVCRRLYEADRASRLCDTHVRTLIESRQLAAFNAIWRTARTKVPFYRELQKRYNLPDQITTLADIEQWPILTKANLRDRGKFARLDVPEPKGRIITGGSTGEPVRLPSWDDWSTGVSQTVGRRAYGVEPGDKMFMLWGHEHLYGTGFKRKINIYKRRFKDWLANWKRVSAYDLSVDAMRAAFVTFEKFQPKAVLGFSPAVLAFVRHNKDRTRTVESVKVVICSAGPLSAAEKQEIEAFFDAKVCMEYGSVECGVMAYTRPEDGRYYTFWNTHLIQAQKDDSGNYKALVTRLVDCYVPLIRYDIGDYLDLEGEDVDACKRSVLGMKDVLGRPSEMISFACGVSFFGALIGDCVKQVPTVLSSQIAVDEAKNILEIRVTADGELSGDDLMLIKNRFELTVADAHKIDVRIVQVEKLQMTNGGKVPRVVRIG